MQYSQENVLYMDVWIFNFWDHWLTLNSIKELTKRSKINCWWSIDIPKLRECYTEMMDRCRPYWENATRKWGINDIPNGECYTEIMDHCHPYSENATSTRKWEEEECGVENNMFFQLKGKIVFTSLFLLTTQSLFATENSGGRVQKV